MAIKKKNFTKDEARQMHYLFECGLTLGDIARRWNTDPNYVRAAIQPMLKKPDSDEPQGTNVKLEFTEAEVKQILQLKNNGHSYEDIAARSGSIPEAIRIVVKNNKSLFNQITTQKAKSQATAVETKHPDMKKTEKSNTRISDEEIAKILEYRKAGFTIDDISKDMNRAHSTINKVIADLKKEGKLENKDYRKCAAAPSLPEADKVQKEKPAEEEKRLSEADIRQISKLLADGTPAETVKRQFGITDQETMDILAPKKKEQDEKPAQPKYGLDSFKPRQIIKYLYEMGYRIENNQLVLIQRTVVKIDDIISSND